LHRDGLIIKKPTVVHSRARVALRNEAKRKGRHTGTFDCILVWMPLLVHLNEFVVVLGIYSLEIVKHTRGKE
jgi:hypothetical protein